MKILATLVFSFSLSTWAGIVEVSYPTPEGNQNSLKLRSEGVNWAEANFDGLEHLSEQKKLGVYYIVSRFLNRINRLDELRNSYDEIYASMTAESLSYAPYFVRQGIRVQILGPGEWITDFPEYAHWKGKTVEEVFGYPGDTRRMDEIDGEATRNTCFLSEHRVGQYPKGSTNTFYHEFAHFIHMSTLTKTEFFLLEKLYVRAKSRNLFLDSYAAMSVHEYFAQGVEAYLAETKTPLDKRSQFGGADREKLFKIDPDLYRFIEKMVETY